MSNRNSFWGKRFGYVHKDGSNALVKRQLSSGREHSGTSQNKTQTAQSKKDQARFKLLGRPIIYFDGRGKRIHAHAA